MQAEVTDHHFFDLQQVESQKWQAPPAKECNTAPLGVELEKEEQHVMIQSFLKTRRDQIR